MSGNPRAAHGGKVQPGDGSLSGPSACMRARGTGRACDKCGDKPLALHVPTRKAGAWCERHCPACNPAGPELKPAAAGAPQNAARLHGNRPGFVRSGNVPDGRCSGARESGG